MKRTLRTLSLLLIIASMLAPTATAHAQSTGDKLRNASVSDIILSGLWSGINFSFGSGSKSNTSAPSPQTPTMSPAPNGTYAALGDSVAAGLGLPTLVQVPSAESRCGRTAEAYPYTVARSMKLSLVHKACSGATAGDLFTEQRSGSPNLPPQLDAAFAGGSPQLLTITAGANDAHWTQFIATCYYSNCATSTETLAANGFLAVLSAKLAILFADIQLRSGNQPPTTVITGYYNPVSLACTTRTHNITADEVTWMTAEVNALNTELQEAASHYSFARFAPIDYTGHDICSADPWVQGATAQAPFHPTAQGQQVIAQSILQILGK